MAADQEKGGLESKAALSFLLRGFGLGDPAKTRGVPVFVSGDEADQITVGNSTEGFGAVAVVAEAASGKDRRPKLAVFGFKAVERGEGDAVSAIEVLEGFKEFGFELG